jgi:nitrogen-specific signal transduction histidine kinase
MQLFPVEPGITGATSEAAAHKQKLDCALQLARTVALDFNNALTGILGHTSFVLGKMEPSNPWRDALLEVEKSAVRAAEIASDLGAFSRQDKENRTQAAGNLNEVLQRTVDGFRKHPAPHPIEYSSQFERRLFTSRFDEAKLQQAFVKILENSAQALNGPGRIGIQTRNIELSEPTQDRQAKLAPGPYVLVEITDNGGGIEPETLPRIFEPFFTTRKATGHRGLGLAWVYGIITNHGGGVAVSSTVGSGTSVRVYLPAEKRIVKDSLAPDGDLAGKETILMVDDEDLLLTLGESILGNYGYRVLTANGGQKAMEILARADQPVDLLITDLVMPGMSGRELMEQARKVRPKLRILCTSGYVWPTSQEEKLTYLQKPFTSRDLLLKVKGLLHG